MTDLILAAVSLVGAWAYAVVAVAVWRAIGERTTADLAIGAIWTIWLAASTTVFALTGTLDWMGEHRAGLFGFLATLVFATAAASGHYIAYDSEIPLPGLTAALWPVAGLCWLVARTAVATARVIAVCATVAVAPARLVGRTRIPDKGRAERIAALEKELEIGD